MTTVRNSKLLLVEDSTATATLYQEFLAELPVSVTHVTEGRAGLDFIKMQDPDVVLLDLKLPDMNGLELMEKLELIPQDPVVVVITAHGSIDMAVEAMKAGAFDFLQKPFDAERLRVTVRNALEKMNLKSLVKTYQDNFERKEFNGFIGSTLPMQAIYRIIESAASSKASVFITGESGTGKDLCANAIHKEGGRCDGPFIPLNCASVPRELMESEIFGHVKGAFTGAVADRKGAAMIADGGTLFLDEIGEMDMALQAKLLRFVQTGTFQRVGGNKQEKVDVRFICATNKDPLEMVLNGAFREDLYYRLHVIPIHLPPLRECGDDVMSIAQKYLVDFNNEEGKDFKGFSVQAEKLLTAYQWPGNVRQLQNIIRNIVVLLNGEEISMAMLPSLLRADSGTVGQDSVRQSIETSDEQIDDQIIKPLWQTEKECIEIAVAKCEGNIPRAAALLEVSPSTIYRKRTNWI